MWPTAWLSSSYADVLTFFIMLMRRQIVALNMNLRKGLELFGDKAEIVTVKELSQIHEMGTYVPLDAGKLTAEQKAKALSSLMFIVEKHDGK